MAAAKRIARSRHVVQNEVEPDARENFEARDAVAGELARQFEKPQRVGGVGEADKGGSHRPRARKEF